MISNIFSVKTETMFYLYGNIIKKTEDSRLVLHKQKTKHKATPPNGKLGFTDYIATTVKPSQSKAIDLKTLIHSAFHSYHPEETEPVIVPY